ncbi:MAG: cytochrome c-type biogenesis protein CcmF [bacterium]|jgi:cytochrome c-type biogenesis protein CcmF
MFIDIGYFALLASLALTLYGFLASSIGIYKNNQNLIQSSKNSSYLIFLLVLVSYSALTYAFIVDDFSVKFVAEHSSTDLPIFYKVTGVWGGMEGSLLLWEMVLSLYIAIVVFRYENTNREIFPYVMIILYVVSGFLLFLLVGWSDPLQRIFPIPFKGQGLNPLLQNIGMVIHPPLLYLGFIGFTIPFAFGMGALLRGKLDTYWILITRRWTLVAWCFLTFGIILGGRWAYLELGWGGYWAWDPVENSSLIPWLTATAFLHSVIVQEKRNTLKIWNLVLISLTFALTMLGTFITRSGVLNSVHAFARSNVGPAFLVFVAIILIFSMGLIFYRTPILESKSQTGGIICKENAFLLNNILLVGIAFTVLYGTVFPLIAEGLANKKLSIQAPFFNKITGPMAFIMLVLMAVTPFLAWKKASLKTVVKNLMLPLSLAVVVMTIIFYTYGHWILVVLSGIVYFAGHSVLLELAKTFKSRRIKLFANKEEQKEGKKSATEAVWKDKRRWGGMITHLGIISLFLGICGSFINFENTYSFKLGEQKQVKEYTLIYRSIKEIPNKNAKEIQAVIEVFIEGKQITTLYPAKAFYPTTPNPTTEVAIYSTLFEDLYLSLSSINKGNSITMNVYINPLIRFVWGSMFFFFFGTIFSLTFEPVQVRKLREQTAKENQERKHIEAKPAIQV